MLTGNIEKDRGKEFETSYLRMWFIMILTYGTLFGYMSLIDVKSPALSAVVPTVGFNLSTWSLPFLKILWIRYNDPVEQQQEELEKNKIDSIQIHTQQQPSEEIDLESANH